MVESFLVTQCMFSICCSLYVFVCYVARELVRNLCELNEDTFPCVHYSLVYVISERYIDLVYHCRLQRCLLAC
jgi:hypothetical protein